METIHWEVKLAFPAKTRSHCQKCCVKTRHVPAGLFRVNANQKQLDIWLLYRCESCGTAWKLTLCTRAELKSLARAFWTKLMNNDEALARQYVMDADLLRRNGVRWARPRLTFTARVAMLLMYFYRILVFEEVC